MEEARGFTGALGVDYLPVPELTLALHFEGPTPLEWEVQRSALNLDQVILDPAVRAGFTSALRASLRAPGEEFRRDLPANLGLEYGWTRELETGVGALYTVTGADAQSYSVENPALDSYTLGLGARYTVDRLALAGGFAANIALDDDAEVATPAGTTVVGLEKHIFLYAVGVEYRAF